MRSISLAKYRKRIRPRQLCANGTFSRTAIAAGTPFRSVLENAMLVAFLFAIPNEISVGAGPRKSPIRSRSLRAAGMDVSERGESSTSTISVFAFVLYNPLAAARNCFKRKLAGSLRKTRPVSPALFSGTPRSGGKRERRNAGKSEPFVGKRKTFLRTDGSFPGNLPGIERASKTD